MAKNRKRKKNKSPKQGHKLVWLTLIIIAIPVVVVLYVLQQSLWTQNTPVVGSRFGSNDLNPEITEEQISAIQTNCQNIDNVEEVTVNLKSATLRVHLNMSDGADEDTIKDALTTAYSIVDNTCPITTYFTNSKNSKMYDLEIDGYNYLVDDSHSQDGQIYVKVTKTGSGKKNTEVLTTPKDEELVNEITR